MYRHFSGMVSPRREFIFGVVVSLATFWGCGGGGGGFASGGGTGTGGAPGDFSLSASPASVSLPGGGSAPISLTATAINGFSGQISVQIGGLPSGVQAVPATVALTPGTAQAITLQAVSAAPQATATVSFTGTSLSLQHTASVNLSIIVGGNGSPPTRTKYIRTDAVTEYYLWVNAHWTIYHNPTGHFFVTDPFSNRIFVIDARTQSEVSTISVPGAYGIDQTPDGLTIWVGTLIGDVYAIDPVTMSITHRYVASGIGPYGFQAISSLVLADGRLALLGQQGGFPSVDGSLTIAIWNPVDNSITFYGTVAPFGAPIFSLCGATRSPLFQFLLTSDRTSVITNAWNDVCELDPSTGQSFAATPAGTGNFVVSPDGKYIAIPIFPGAVELIDQKTLQHVAQFNVTTDNLSDATVLFSPDSKTLYVSGSSFVYAYDVATGQQLGWIPQIVVSYTSGGLAVGPPWNPNYGAFDTSGLMVGPSEEGFGFLDVTQLHSNAPGPGFLNAFLNPATGPLTGGTVTQWSAATPSEVYFGKNIASFEPGSGGLTSVIAPPGAPGPADVYLFLSDGEMQLVAEGFSYGPAILEVSPECSTADGGGTGVIYGYGFGPLNPSGVPSGLTVNIGGQPATVTGFNPNTYNEGSPAPPFPLQSIYYRIPPGIAGSQADVVVTSSSGATTAKAAINYLPALKPYSLPGSSLVQGVYDPIRDVYYFTDTNKIQVFSLPQGAWLSPIVIPPLPGSTQRLWGIALSADGTKLAVSDAQAGAVYLLDPANPASVKTFPIKPTGVDAGPILVMPAGVAVTNSGVVWLTVDVQGGTGYDNYFTLDTNTGQLTDLGIRGPGLGKTDFALRVALSPDDTRAYFNNDGYVFSIDTSTNNIVSASVNPGCCYGDYDLAIMSSQTQVEASSYLYGWNLDGEATLALNDREIQDTVYVNGVKFSPDGSLLFQPSAQGIDVFDGRVGVLLSRIALPVQLSTQYDAVVSDGKDNVLIAITGTAGTGIAVVDLTSIQEPAPLPYSVAESSEARVNDGTASVIVAHGTTGTNKNASVMRHRTMPHVIDSAPIRLPKEMNPSE